jgi:5-bromo-4-chloroindolyl phosphate hydrolysis protein
MLPLSSQTLLNDSTCCVPCIALKKALLVKTEKEYFKNQLGVARDSIVILDKIVFNQDSIIKIKDTQIALYIKNESDYKQVIENKDKGAKTNKRERDVL